MKPKFEWTEELIEKYRFFKPNVMSSISPMKQFIILHTPSRAEARESADKKYPEGILGLVKKENGKVLREDVAFPRLWGLSYQKEVGLYIGAGFQIETVENSSGEILTVGDETNEGKITAFTIGEKWNVIYAKNQMDTGMEIDHVHPVKTTYWVSKEDYSVTTFQKVGHAMYAFDNKIDAEKFAKDNKPRFSKNQIEQSIVDTSDAYASLMHENDLVILNKSKLGL